MNDLNIKFFKATSEGRRLGGGYIETGGLKINFNLWKNDKFPSGFNIALPSTRKDDGTYFNDVDFLNKESRNLIYQKMSEIINGQDSHPESRVVTEPSAVSRAGFNTSVDVKASVKRFDKAKVPF